MYTDDSHYAVFSIHGYVTAESHRKRFVFKFDNYVSRPIRFTHSRHEHCISSRLSRKTMFLITRFTRNYFLRQREHPLFIPDKTRFYPQLFIGFRYFAKDF